MFLKKKKTVLFTSPIILPILCKKTVQIKIWYDNKCTKNVHHSPTYIKKCTNCTKFVQSSNQKQHETWNVYLCTCKQCTNYIKATSKLKQTFYAIWTYTHCINYTKCMQMLIESCVVPIYVFCIYKTPRFFNF